LALLDVLPKSLVQASRPVLGRLIFGDTISRMNCLIARTHARYLKKLAESHKLPTVLSINVAARARKADVFCGRKQLGLQCSVDEFKR